MIESEACAANRIILGVVEMVVATTEEESRKIIEAKADAFKMLSIMAKVAEFSMPTETR